MITFIFERGVGLALEERLVCAVSSVKNFIVELVHKGEVFEFESDNT